MLAIQRWGGILIHPRSTLASLGPNEGRHDWWWLAGLFVLGSQVQHLTEAVARYQAFRSLLVLFNALALSLLTPLLVGLLVEALVGSGRSRYRHLPVVCLVAVATVGHLLRQQGVELPGPRYLPEMLGTVWAAGLALWIRKRMPEQEAAEPIRNFLPSRMLGASTLAIVLISGARDLGIGLDNFDSYMKVTPGDPLPEFAAKLDDGSAFSPETLTGEVSLLTFWATWCHACGLEMPTVGAIAEHYAGTPDVRIYGINRDSGPPIERRRKVEAYLDKRDLDFAQVYDDGQLAQAFGVEQIPYMVIVDKQGQIRHLHLGQVSERTLRSEIDVLLDEPAVTPGE